MNNYVKNPTYQNFLKLPTLVQNKITGTKSKSTKPPKLTAKIDVGPIDKYLKKKTPVTVTKSKNKNTNKSPCPAAILEKSVNIPQRNAVDAPIEAVQEESTEVDASSAVPMITQEEALADEHNITMKDFIGFPCIENVPL